jgi:integrase
MVRTGLRLAEQASLTVLELPTDDAGVAYQRFWLPDAVAKNGSSRWVYLPAALARKVGEYCAADRAEIIADARRRGTYDRIRDPLVIDPVRGPASAVVVRRPDSGEAITRLEQLTSGERARLLVRTPDGLEPAALWLAEHGMPW